MEEVTTTADKIYKNKCKWQIILLKKTKNKPSQLCQKAVRSKQSIHNNCVVLVKTYPIGRFKKT